MDGTAVYYVWTQKGNKTETHVLSLRHILACNVYIHIYRCKRINSKKCKKETKKVINR